MADEELQWQSLTGLDTSGIESVAETVGDTAQTIASFLQSVAGILRVVAMFIPPDVDIIKSLVNAAIAALQAAITDLLQTNAAMAFHVNMVWDPDWVYDYYHLPSWNRTVPNWYDDRDIPWSGSGIDGWLIDIAASGNDRSNPFRPLTDNETAVAGAIYVIGVPSFEEIGSIVELLSVFTDFDHFEDIFDESRLDAADKEAAIFRAKEALFSEELSKWHSDPTSIKADLEAALESTINDWSFRPGSFPKWVSVPMARVFPVIYELFNKLQNLVDAFLQPIDNPLAALAELLAYKAELMANLALEIGNIIQQLIQLATLLEGGHFISIQVGSLSSGEPDSEEGGLNSWIKKAIAAENKPDLGPTAIFGGIVVIATGDNPINHLQSLWDLLGVSIDEYTETPTARTAQIEDTIEEITF